MLWYCYILNGREDTTVQDIPSTEWQTEQGPGESDLCRIIKSGMMAIMEDWEGRSSNRKLKTSFTVQ